MRNNEITNTIDIFVYGMSGSGKDTISDYLKDYYGYRKMRLAGTIKQVICEKFKLTHDELETLKRSEQKYRDEHHIVSNNNGNQESSLNRLQQIVDRTAYDFNILTKDENINKPVVICDVRTFEEAQQLLNAGFVGIFLSRITGEYKNPTHFTEQNLFGNSNIFELIDTDDNIDRCVIIFNGDNKVNYPNFGEMLETFENEYPGVGEFNNLLVIEKSSPDRLLEAVDIVLAKYIDWELDEKRNS